MTYEFERISGPFVSFGDGNKGETLGYASIKLGNIIIENVALVEGLKHTLLSISQLSDKGYHAYFDNTKCIIISMISGKIVLIGQRHEKIYESILSVVTQGKVRCLFSKASTKERWKWHKALSHLNFKKMNHLIKHNLVKGLSQLKFVQDGLCDAYEQGKQRRISFQSKQENSIVDPFHLLYLDLFGPVNIMSMKKKRFALVVVDDYTRLT